MTLLYLFSKETNFFPLTKVNNSIVFDHNILNAENFYSDEYEMAFDKINNRLIKKIEWKNGVPYAYNKVLKKEIRFVALTEYAKLSRTKLTITQRIESRIKTLIKN